MTAAPKATKRQSKPTKRKPKPRKRISKRPRASRKKAVLYADSLWSQIVRRREGGCVSGRDHHAGNFQAAHGFSRRYWGTRWNLMNGHKLCQGCHVYYTHRPLEWDDWLLKELERVGPGYYQVLRKHAMLPVSGDLAKTTAALEAVLHTGEK